MPPQLLTPQPQAILALADGTVFQGISIGAPGRTVGEVVFNTSMTGYQEILTDPSYCRQIVTLTYPHIGNYGVNGEDVESSAVQAAGLVIKELPVIESNFRSTSSLARYLRDTRTVAIAAVDTRRLTRRLRSDGAQNGCILALPDLQLCTPAYIDEAIALARGAPSMTGLDLAQVVSCAKPFGWQQSAWSLEQGYARAAGAGLHVVAYDFGAKYNILRMLVSRGCRVTVVPAKTPAHEALALRPDGIFLSNGPGDPQPCAYAIEAARSLIDSGVPTFGICLGHQIMALASGARTFKMKFGHHGANHPVKDLDSGKVCITATLRPTHLSLFDGTLQGLARTDRPALSFQGHPEASPGPHDIDYLFDRFTEMMQAASSGAKGALNA
ncbi:MAG: glutamine-hydrolyzing carbamoyl-phosphate synthase small subunit [Burkholderiaceae bacterium]